MSKATYLLISWNHGNIMLKPTQKEPSWSCVLRFIIYFSHFSFSAISRACFHIRRTLVSVHNSSVLWQKGESQNGGNKNTKHAKFSEKRTFFYPLIRTRTCTYQGVKNVRFSENWRALYSCYLRFEIRSFAIVPTNYSISQASF